ncbi:hypothetical protein AbraIFM66951_007835 [Aspergillus brasiliensis]|uniref:Uncharacterized protein n=1 Tax=Aspergillus brasiliensis (strain CBS 101740 / IMI 381727 / IBT 21946) TaxID=767769 RepID=A0A1L9U5A5_ASPBC|nr:hypothetical protein ASPBRDRAFT_187514 [Aspergillus brasiliensis CBS 101740]GKZ45233.1 hypothetical protein AbraIFM66951_007835 [Aspergillus brasiliensis]
MLSFPLFFRTARLSKASPGARYITSTAYRFTEAKAQDSSHQTQSTGASTDQSAQQKLKQDKTKSVAQADQELRERLEQMSGDGGAAGIEYEDGKPNAMKRSVRNNMFRYI